MIHYVIRNSSNVSQIFWHSVMNGGSRKGGSLTFGLDLCLEVGDEEPQPLLLLGGHAAGDGGG